MNAHEDMLALARAWALGALDDAERLSLEAHLAQGCAECEATLRDARAVADALVLGVDPVAPSERARAGLLARAREAARAPAPRRALGRGAWLGLAAGLALAVGVGLYAGSLADTLEAERAARQEAVRRLGALQERVDTVTGPGTRTVALAGQGPAASASAQAYVVPGDGRLVLYVYDLPPPPAGRTYQLWVIIDSTPVDAGTFGVDAAGRASHEVRLSSDLGGAGVAVTVEPEGGVSAPTGDVVLAGS